MTKYIKIFLLYFQNLLEHKGRSFVWFLLSILGPFIFLLFWKGASAGNNTIPAQWTYAAISTYYFLLISAGSLLVSHIEGDIAIHDIQEGRLAMYITKPFPYYLLMFFEEIPWRIFQGFLGIILSILLITIFKANFNLTNDLLTIFLAFLSAGFAYFISFTFKMILAFTAFWLIDISGFFQLMQVIMLVFGGFLIPLELLPDSLHKISLFLPFAYIVYFPVTILQGKYDLITTFRILLTQIFWLLLLAFLYRKIWRAGLKKFTGVGQ